MNAAVSASWFQGYTDESYIRFVTAKLESALLCLAGTTFASERRKPGWRSLDSPACHFRAGTTLSHNGGGTSITAGDRKSGRRQESRCGPIVTLAFAQRFQHLAFHLQNAFFGFHHEGVNCEIISPKDSILNL
jgi:hypothetical protein